MLAAIRERLSRPRRFRRALAMGTPLIDGRETRQVSRAIRYDVDRAVELVSGSVPFDPRDTFAERALEWARGG